MITKEEFKGRIMSQLKTFSSPMHYLCLDPDATQRRYRNKTVLACSEFNLDIVIEPIESEERFSVMFVDWEMYHEIPFDQLDISDVRTIGHREYIYEDIEVTNEAIGFYVATLKLASDNYNFFVLDDEPVWRKIGSIDFLVKEYWFSEEEIGLQDLADARRDPNVVYSDCPLRDALANQIDSKATMIESAFGKEFADEIRKLFRAKNSGKGLSNMMHIMNKLMEANIR